MQAANGSLRCLQTVSQALQSNGAVLFSTLPTAAGSMLQDFVGRQSSHSGVGHDTETCSKDRYTVLSIRFRVSGVAARKQHYMRPWGSVVTDQVDWQCFFSALRLPGSHMASFLDVDMNLSWVLSAHWRQTYARNSTCCDTRVTRVSGDRNKI